MANPTLGFAVMLRSRLRRGKAASGIRQGIAIHLEDEIAAFCQVTSDDLKALLGV